ncbi:hypothetical protein MPER_04212, partial [Moniliophthora perniciosa FA553]
ARVNLELCLQSSVGKPKRILFASSIAVVGNYPTLNADDDYCWDIPERAIDARATDDFGYPEAKWVCETVLDAANALYGVGEESLVRGSSVRIGQMTGPEGVGAWQRDTACLEWITIMDACQSCCFGILENLYSILAGPRQQPLPLIPFAEWIERVQALGNDPSVNTAAKIMQFIQHDFVRMASGTVILNTKYAKEDSPTM